MLALGKSGEGISHFVTEGADPMLALLVDAERSSVMERSPVKLVDGIKSPIYANIQADSHLAGAWFIAQR